MQESFWKGEKGIHKTLYKGDKTTLRRSEVGEESWMGCNTICFEAKCDSLKSRLHYSCFDYNRINSSEQKYEMVSSEMLSQTTYFADSH